MKKTTKLIAFLTAVAMLTGLIALAVADDLIYTSPIFKLPKDRIEAPEETVPPTGPEETVEPGTEVDPDVTVDPGSESDPTGTEEPEPDKPVERNVMIYSTRKDVVTKGDIIELTGVLIGFDDVPDSAITFQWQVDRNDGAGWQDVEGANRWYYKFIANQETILYNWRLIVNVNE